MARVILNSFIRDTVASLGHPLPEESHVDIPANSVRALITSLDQHFPGCAGTLAQAAMAIDGDIYSNALTEPLDDSAEVVFIPAIEGG